MQETRVPSWLRRAVSDTQGLAGKGVEEVALLAGGAIAALDAVVRAQGRWAGAWRQRLALSAAALAARQAGRVEDQSALRDAVLLTRQGDDVGPAGRILLAWRRLAATPADELLSEVSIRMVMDDFGLAYDDGSMSCLIDDLGQLSANDGTVAMTTRAFAVAEQYGLGRVLGAWLADALLAQRLGWTQAMPLLGAEAALGTTRSRRAVTAGQPQADDVEAGRTKSLLAAQARAALRAIDLSTELGRRADKLLAVAPKLRAKASDAVVERLLSDDAVIASEKIAGMSDRGLRRLFDRLMELGAVRELSGRPAFRVYGL
ncbi:DUF1403 family protein [Aquamicrobium soli]|uniref:DUF1403 family protein n=1 Tax=Aquamicrobium soli TaxID=1811518 RepID=A0ABV7K2T7_9HYPH